jgi:hypothetical protein
MSAAVTAMIHTCTLLFLLYTQQLTALLAVSVPSPPELSSTYDGSAIDSGASQVGGSQGESGNAKNSNVESCISSSAMDTCDTAAAGAADVSKEPDRSDTNDNK